MTEAEQKTAQETPAVCKKRHNRFGIRTADLIIVILIMAICGLQAVQQLTNSVGATIMLRSAFSDNGRNPDGTPFSIMELFNDEILNNAVSKLDGELTTQELRSHLSVSDTMSSSSYARLEQSIRNGENENTYFPTGYLVTYSTITEQIRNEGVAAQWESLWKSFFLPDKAEILSAVLKSYQEYYADNYLNYDALFDIDWIAADEMDYYHRAEFMSDATVRLLRFLQTKNTNQMLHAEATGSAAYRDVIAEITQGPYQDIDAYKAYVTQNGVTNNKAALLRQFAYMQSLYEEENARKMQEHTVLREAIEMYDATTTKVVFIPALDDENVFYMNRTKVGVDYLTGQADVAKVQAETAAYTAKHYAYLQDCFSGEYTAEEGELLSRSINTAAQRDHADELYESIKEEIQRLVVETAKLAEEGKQLNQEELRISEPSNRASLVSVAMSSAKRFAFLFMAAYVVIYITRVVTEKKHKESRE